MWSLDEQMCGRMTQRRSHCPVETLQGASSGAPEARVASGG